MTTGEIVRSMSLYGCHDVKPSYPDGYWSEYALSDLGYLDRV